MVFVIISIFFIQYNVSNTEIDLWIHGSNNKIDNALEWLLMEVVVFYLFILSGSVYLGSISCRGIYQYSDYSNERMQR